MEDGNGKPASPAAFRAVWRTEVAVRINELEHRLEVAEKTPTAPTPGPVIDETLTTTTATTELSVHVKETPRSAPRIQSDVRQGHMDAADKALGVAREAIREERRHPWSRLRAWWTGTAVTAAWESVHDAEAELVDLESEEDIRAALPRLLAWIQEVMPSGDQRNAYERQLKEFADGTKPADRTIVRQAYRDVIVANNEKHANVRQFRNNLMVVAVVLGMLMCVLAVWHSVNPQFISLCGVPSETASKATSAVPSQRCVNGSSNPRPSDVAEVVLVGAIGGMLSIAFSLGGTATPPSRYDPRLAQGALKPAAGAATALIGVLLIQSEILIAPASNISESLLLSYAAVFGFSQQLLTQFVDKRGSKLLGEADTTTGAAKA